MNKLHGFLVAFLLTSGCASSSVHQETKKISDRSAVRAIASTPRNVKPLKKAECSYMTSRKENVQGSTDPQDRTTECSVKIQINPETGKYDAVVYRRFDVKIDGHKRKTFSKESSAKIASFKECSLVPAGKVALSCYDGPKDFSATMTTALETTVWTEPQSAKLGVSISSVEHFRMIFSTEQVIQSADGSGMRSVSGCFHDGGDGGLHNVFDSAALGFGDSQFVGCTAE